MEKPQNVGRNTRKSRRKNRWAHNNPPKPTKIPRHRRKQLPTTRNLQRKSPNVPPGEITWLSLKADLNGAMKTATLLLPKADMNGIIKRIGEIMFQCKNPACNRKILILGRISEERKPSAGQMFTEITRTILEAPCCPFCGSKEFEEVQGNKE